MFTRKEYESYFGKISDTDWENVQNPLATQWIEFMKKITRLTNKKLP